MVVEVFTRLKFVCKNWKLGVHLLFRTKRFGVNNGWWSVADSVVMGAPTSQILWDIVRIWPIVRNYKLMKIRAIHLGFMSLEECALLWPKDEAVRRRLKARDALQERKGP